MNKLTLYHGAPKIIQKPLYGNSKGYHDYGPGFYCTTDPELAKEWACTKYRDGYVSQYELLMNDLKVLDLCEEDTSILYWFALMINNRLLPVTTPVMKKAFEKLRASYLPNLDAYDVIIGYRGDDSYFSYVRAYVEDEISLPELERLMKESGAQQQVVLRSKKAFEHIRFVSVISVDAAEYYIKRRMRDSESTKEIQNYRRTLAEAMDYAVNSCKLTLDEFMELFITGGLAEQFQEGVSKYVTGLTGAELACEVLQTAGLEREFPVPRISFTVSREYWCGWMLAYYQRISNLSFKRIRQFVTMKDIEKLHFTLKSSSDERFVHAMNQMIENANAPTQLHRLRTKAGYSQKGLAETAGVNLRNIQQYEQRAKNINKAAAGTLAALAQVLGCRIEDLLE